MLCWDGLVKAQLASDMDVLQAGGGKAGLLVARLHKAPCEACKEPRAQPQTAFVLEVAFDGILRVAHVKRGAGCARHFDHHRPDFDLHYKAEAGFEGRQKPAVGAAGLEGHPEGL